MYEGDTMTYTEKEIDNWRDYEEVRQSGLYNVFDSQARASTGLTKDEYFFVMHNYTELKAAAQPR
jgi:hypothetical protein